MTPGRRDWLITTYLARAGRTKPLTRAERLSEPSQGADAWALVSGLIVHDPDAAWSILLELIQRASTRNQLGMIAAGHIEDFISQHWEEWTDRVEEQAARDPRLRYCLSKIVLQALPVAHQARVKKAAADGAMPADVRP